jgi:WD40 repeat protein
MSVHRFALAICIAASVGFSFAQTPKTDLHGDPLPPGAMARLGTVRWRAENVIALARFVDDKSILTVAQDHIVQLWDIASGKEVRRFDISGAPAAGADFPSAFLLRPSGAESMYVALSRDGKRLAASGRDGTVRVWNVTTGEEVRRIAGAPTGVTQLALSHDGKLLATFYSGRPLQIWDTTREAAPTTLGDQPDHARPSYTYQIDFAADGKTFVQIGLNMAVAGGGGFKPTVTIWDIAASKVLRSITDAPAGASTSSAYRAAISPDHRLLAMPLADSIALISLASGEEVGRIKEGVDPNRQSLLFAPDSKSLIGVTAPSESMTIWRVSDGKTLRTFGNPPAPDANALPMALGRGLSGSRVSADGRTMLWTDGPTLRLIDLESGQTRNQLSGHTGSLREAFYAAGGIEIWTRSLDGTIRRWDSNSSRELGKWAPPSSTTTCLITPNGKWLVFADPQKRTIRIVDTATGKQHAELAPDAFGYTYEVSPDSKWVAVTTPGGGGTASLYDVGTGEKKHNLLLPPPRDPAMANPNLPPGVMLASGRTYAPRIFFSPDGRFFAVSTDSFVTVWDAARGNRIGQIPVDAEQMVQHATFSSDGRTISVESSAGVSIWEVATGTKRFALQSTKPAPVANPNQYLMFGTAMVYPCSLAHSPDGRLLARSVHSGSISILDAWTGQELGSLASKRGTLVTVAFAPDSRRLVSANSDTTALIWDLESIRAKLAQPKSNLDDAAAAAHWAALVDADGGKAYDAIRAFTGDPGKAISILRGRVKPAVGPDAKALAKSITELGDPKFATRERARKDLERLGEAAGPALRQTAESSPSTETRKVAKKLLESLSVVSPTGEKLRALRAVEVLERIGAPEAVELLKNLATGAAEVIPTPQAQWALERLGAKK